jgi:hypothetical protein
MRLVRRSGGPRLRPPRRVQILRLALLTQAAITVALWLGVWRSLKTFAWAGGGVETDLLERSLSYLLVLAPAVPVHVLAAFWLGRGGHRARLYLACSGVLVAVQQVLLLSPIDPGGSLAPGLAFALTVGPPAFASLALAMTPETKAWLREAGPRSTRRVAGIEGVAWCMTAFLVLGVASSVDRWVAASTETGPPVGEHDESDVWARMESAVTATAASPEPFPGFEARTVQVTACGYRTEAGLRTYRYLLVYELEPFAETAEETAYARAVREAWSSGDYQILYDGATADGAASIRASREDELTLHLVLGSDAALEVRSGCLERVDPDPGCLQPQGGVAPEHDTVEGLLCLGKD